jgi:hypothetical protein
VPVLLESGGGGVLILLAFYWCFTSTKVQILTQTTLLERVSVLLESGGGRAKTAAWGAERYVAPKTKLN